VRKTSAPRTPQGLTHAENDGRPVYECVDVVDGEAGTGRGTVVAANSPILTILPTAYAFVAAIKAKQQQVQSKTHWDVTPIEMEGFTYPVYSRYVPLGILQELRHATNQHLWAEALGNVQDGARLRSGAIASDIFIDEQANLQRRRAKHCFIVGVLVFIDDQEVSFLGAHYIFPIRVRVLSVLDGASLWVTVWYIPHVHKPVGRSTAAKRVASYSHNALLQRCVSILLRRV